VTKINPAVESWLRTNNFGEIRSTSSVGGGCIHQTLLIKTTTGGKIFLKQNQNIPPDMFEKEAQGLSALKFPDGPVVPQVYLVGKTYLLLEDIEPSPRCDNFWSLFGRQLAYVHDQVHSQFGFHNDNYIGSNPQKNTWMEDGFEFFQACRFKPQVDLALSQSLLSSNDIRLIEKVMEILPDIIPDQPASLLHGDLWSGNLISDSRGMPALIDPAVYYGWAEADLAMTDLFGTYPESFYQAYTEVRSLESGYRSRYPIYNLYHLLNHLNLFGKSYLPQIRGILSRFVS
jgi:fructosamine-3-kinase